jgi:hypothetical protein
MSLLIFRVIDVVPIVLETIEEGVLFGGAQSKGPFTRTLYLHRRIEGTQITCVCDLREKH